jgi:hypothetical protein
MGIKSRISQTPQDKTRSAHQGVLFVEGVPESTKNAFKRACVGKETMRDAVIRLMRFYVYNKGVIPEETEEE